MNGAAAPTNVALVTAGAEGKLNPTVSLSANLDGEFASRYRSYAGTGTLRFALN